MTKVNVYGVDGKVKEQVDLPEVFNTPFRPDMIRKSFNVLHSNKRQPYGASPLGGKRHAVDTVGKGRGMSRVPRLTQGRRAAFAPCVVGGRRAHPPKAEKNWKEKINTKERRKSIQSALAATKEKDIVSGRGHQFEDKVTLPIVIEDRFGKTKKTKDVISILEKIGIYDDVLRAANGKHIRAGKGKTRGRKYRIPKSILIVAQDNTISKSSRNLTGVDFAQPEHLNIEHLAPGGDPGRLTVITKSALQKLGGGA
jgi:large subunit ribosomal protein L4e